MRKSRAKCIDTKAWVVGYYVPTLDRKNHQIFGEDGIIYTVDPDTLEESIEIPDKYGNDIFTGNVLRIHNDFSGGNDSHLGIVALRKGSYVTVTPNYLGGACDADEHEDWNFFGTWNVPYVWWEIVGDIHDAPATPPICEIGDTIFYIDYSSECLCVKEATVQKVLPYTEHIVVPGYGEISYCDVFKTQEDAENELKAPETTGKANRESKRHLEKQSRRKLIEGNERHPIEVFIGLSVNLSRNDIDRFIFDDSFMGAVVKVALREGYYDPHGTVFIHEKAIEEYNQKYNSDYEAKSRGCRINLATLTFSKEAESDEASE